mgnify:CR=1 FL=1
MAARADEEPVFSGLGRQNQLAESVFQGRSEDPRTWLAAIIESSEDAIVSKSIDGIIMSWNAAAAELVDGFFEAAEAQEMHITTGMGKEAIRALSVYGKVVGHAAQLNFGDALSYACAKAYHVPLLYKGGDFSETDLA